MKDRPGKMPAWFFKQAGQDIRGRMTLVLDGCLGVLSKVGHDVVRHRQEGLHVLYFVAWTSR
jgi:hypothetical protein